MAYAFYAYPWTVSADTISSRQQALRQMGVERLTLATSYHAGKFIQPAASKSRVYFPEDGTVYFQPKSNYGLLKPQVAACCQEQDPLAIASTEYPQAISAWTVLCHNSRLGLQHPDVTVQNAWGNRYPYSLCPVHPEVRAYAIRLCHDLAAHYSLHNLLLETPGFLAYNHGYHHEFAQVEPNPWLEAWLGLCFCDHCVKGAAKAGIDALALSSYAVTAIDEFLDSDARPGSAMSLARLQAELIQQPELSAFLRWRCDQVTQLVSDIVQACKAYCPVKVIATTQKTHANAVWEGMDLAALNAVSDGLELPLYQQTTEDLQADAQQVLQSVAQKYKVSAILRPAYPDMQSEEQLTDSVVALHKLGIKDIAFYNLDLLRPCNIRWVEQAITTVSQQL